MAATTSAVRRQGTYVQEALPRLRDAGHHRSATVRAGAHVRLRCTARAEFIRNLPGSCTRSACHSPHVSKYTVRPQSGEAGPRSARGRNHGASTASCGNTQPGAAMHGGRRVVRELLRDARLLRLGAGLRLLHAYAREHQRQLPQWAAHVCGQHTQGRDSLCRVRQRCVCAPLCLSLCEFLAVRVCAALPPVSHSFPHTKLLLCLSLCLSVSVPLCLCASVPLRLCVSVSLCLSVSVSLCLPCPD